MVSSAVALLMEVGLIMEWSDIKLHIRDARMEACMVKLSQNNCLGIFRIFSGIFFINVFLPLNL